MSKIIMFSSNTILERVPSRLAGRTHHFQGLGENHCKTVWFDFKINKCHSDLRVWRNANLVKL